VQRHPVCQPALVPCTTVIELAGIRTWKRL
jgi:hypothetical protein